MTRLKQNLVWQAEDAAMRGPKSFEQLIGDAALHRPASLLFVFAESTSGALPFPGVPCPVVAIEKSLDELSSFEALAHEVSEVSPSWDFMLAAEVLADPSGKSAPGAVTHTMRRMAECAQQRKFGGFTAFSRSGEVLTVPPSADTLIN